MWPHVIFLDYMNDNNVVKADLHPYIPRWVRNSLGDSERASDEPFAEPVKCAILFLDLSGSQKRPTAWRRWAPEVLKNLIISLPIT